MNILLLCNYQPYEAGMVTDHINAFSLYSKHKIKVCSCLVKNGGDFRHKTFSFNDFDVILVHYSIFLVHDHYISENTRLKLKKFRGTKGIFLQDEYNSVDKIVDLIATVGFDVVFTCVLEESIQQVYPSEKLPKVKFINVLTGYVPITLPHYPTIPLVERKFDVSYRGRKYPIWYGRLGLEKWQIVSKFLKNAKPFKLRCNISYKEKDRLYGIKWVNLLSNSIATLGTESGASVFDFTDNISIMVNVYEKLFKTPSFFDKYFRGAENVAMREYKYLKEKYFAELEDKIQYAQISPRVFEAMALRTLCILYEGKYSDILVPWRHYVPLKKDYSNMSEVVKLLKNKIRVAEIITNAYKEIVLNPKYSYKTFINQLDVILEEIHIKKSNLEREDFVGGDYKSRKNKKLLLLIKKLKLKRNRESCFNMVRDPYSIYLPVWSTIKSLKVVQMIKQKIKTLI